MILLFSIIFLNFFNLGFRGVLLSYILSYSILIVFIFFSAKLFEKIKLYYFSLKLLKKLTRYSVPLIPNTISWWLTNAGINNPRVLLLESNLTDVKANIKNSISAYLNQLNYTKKQISYEKKCRKNSFSKNSS